MKSATVTVLLGCLLVACNKPSEGTSIVKVDRRVEELSSSPIPEVATHEVKAWAKLGVARVKTVAPPEGVDHRAVLLDAAGAKMGSIEVSELDGGSRRVVTHVNDLRVKFELADPGVFRITDLTTGRTGVARFDHESKTFRADSMYRALQTEFAAIVPISMGTMGAIESQRQSDAADAEVEESNSPFDVVPPATDALGICRGSWYRGGTWWGVRSECCVIARNNAAVQCSNALCLGCCEYRACDSWCMGGDYTCVCGISGRACG